ncbi:MAG: hypothetical protein WCS37_14955, partial [Chloroflexota bacterium]
MQTQPKPPETASSEDSPVNSLPKSRRLERNLNLGLALSGLALYLLSLTKGADFYNTLPGGRKLLVGVVALLFGGGVLARLYLVFGV